MKTASRAMGFRPPEADADGNLVWTHRSADVTANLKPGSRRMEVNGTTLWLNAPARNESRRLGALHIVDLEHSVRPLLLPERHPPLPLRVLLDPGHGGEDGGATTPGELLVEKHLVLEITTNTAARLRSAGFDVRTTRSDDVFVSLNERVRMATEWPADVFVSVHLNAALNPSARGAETFVLPAPGFPATAKRFNPPTAWAGCANNAKSVLLAYAVHSRLPLRRTGENDRGIRRARFQVLQTPCPAILVECGFLSNTQDARALLNPETRTAIATAIAEGIQDYARRIPKPRAPGPVKRNND